MIAAVAAAVLLAAATTVFPEATKAGLRDTPLGVEQSTDTPRTVDKGEQSNIDEARQVVVRTEADWTKLWQQHSPDRKRPTVDFSKDMVVGVFMGSRSSAGYNLSIVSTFVKDGAVLVRYQESTPRPGTMSAQILTFPYHLVAIPKAAGEVKFEKVEK